MQVYSLTGLHIIIITYINIYYNSCMVIVCKNNKEIQTFESVTVIAPSLNPSQCQNLVFRKNHLQPL